MSASSRWRVSKTGRITGCPRAQTPGLTSASPQDSSSWWAGRTQSAVAAVSSGWGEREITVACSSASRSPAAAGTL